MKKFKGTYFDIALVIILLIYILYSRQPIDFQAIIGAGIAILGIIFWLIARYQLGEAFSITPQSKFIVSQGIYKKIRHPIYLFSIITFAGLCLAGRTTWLYYILPILILIQILRARREETILIRKFGQQYIQYKKTTWF